MFILTANRLRAGDLVYAPQRLTMLHAKQALITLSAVATLALSTTVSALPPISVGGQEGEVDVNTGFLGAFGQSQPTERPSSWQPANTKVLSMGAGYAFGKLGPFHDIYVRLDGSYYTSAEENVPAGDDLAAGFTVFQQDRGGYLTGTAFAKLIHQPRFSFGLYVQGSLPIDVNFEKFSNVRIHYFGGGTTVDVFLTDPAKLLRLRYRSRLFLGTGAMQDDYQHNASINLDNLLLFEAERWVLPWRMGIGIGPSFESDLNEHVNQAYYQSYARVTADFVNGDRVRAMSFAVTLAPYFRITKHAALEVRFRQQLAGIDSPATQIWAGGLRATF